ncbi:MAG: NAD(P)H-binding protein [Campylobacter sp.]|nr:NAD(P)H-binding protein [Campylobacter sp.]
MGKKALIVGATGVVGREILNELLSDESYDKITIWVRRDPEISHPKLTTKVINFDEISQISPEFFDEIFCALGTTMKIAGSKEAFLKVDVEYVKNTAIWGKMGGAKRFLLVSAPNADENSMFFYFRAKAMAEKAVIAQNYETTQIFAPPLIKGERKDKRIMEKFMIGFYELFPKSWFDNYPMSGKEIAKQIVKAAKMGEKGVKFYRLRAVDLKD